MLSGCVRQQRTWSHETWLCSVGGGEGGSCDGRGDGIGMVALVGVRCRGFDQLLGPTKRRSVRVCVRGGDTWDLYLSDRQS